MEHQWYWKARSGTNQPSIPYQTASNPPHLVMFINVFPNNSEAGVRSSSGGGGGWGGWHSVAGAEVNAKISVFWGRRLGGEGGGRGRTGERREDGERVGPGCWCEWDEGRKRREKISIYGKKTEGSIIQGGALRCVNYYQKCGGGIRQSLTVRADLRISVFFFYLCNRRWGRRTRQRREEKMLWAATCRDVERQKRGETGRGRTTLKMVVLRVNIQRMRRPSDKS